MLFNSACAIDGDNADTLSSSGGMKGLHRAGVHHHNHLNKQRGKYGSTLPLLNTRLGEHHGHVSEWELGERA